MVNLLDALKLVYTGNQLLQQGDLENAENNLRRAVRIDPQCEPAWNSLLDFLAAHKCAEEAIQCLAPLVEVTPKTAESLYELAGKMFSLKQYEQSRRVLNDALTLEPSKNLATKISLLLAHLDLAESDWPLAFERANQILQEKPRNLEALFVRQKYWSCVSYVPEDVADSRLSVQLQPDSAMHSHLLFHLNYLTSTTPEALYQESRRWNNMYAAPLASKIARHSNIPDPNRRLKIGYFSPDLKHHPIMKLLPAVFEKYDAQQFEVFAYSIRTQEDQVTEYVRAAVENFVALPASRDAIAARVRSDKIDILVDLAGHTFQSPAYLALALKPAPVQVTWMGALATTGLSTMDYFLGDALMPAPDTEHLFSERVHRLARTHCCYRPAEEPQLAPAPFFRNGHITFGCFNSAKKITREIVKVWSVILHLHPGSKILLKYKHLEREVAQQRLREWFSDDGISTDRLLFEGPSVGSEYLTSWNKVDIALDPFPYNGGTTTMDALWMGVPVVSLAGRLAVSCCGATLVTSLGLPVASTPEQYISIAAQLAKAIPCTPGIRQQVRQAMLKSPLMDESGMVNALESAYRSMWRTWCEGEGVT